MTTELEHQADLARQQTMVAEMRALELLEALRNAVAGASHWRMEAQALLDRIEAGVLPSIQEQLTTHREAA
jgi:hypothetical protein